MCEAFSHASLGGFLPQLVNALSAPSSVSLLCVSFLPEPPERGHESGVNSQACEGPGHRGEEWFKHAEEGWVGGRKLPLVSELEMGQDGQEYFGAHWLKPEICKPCSASCFLFSVSSGCSCMCAGQHDGGRVIGGTQKYFTVSHQLSLYDSTLLEINYTWPDI